MNKKKYRYQKAETISLKKLNRRFYNLIVDLNRCGVSKTSEIAAFAYEHFWEELNKSFNFHQLN